VLHIHGDADSVVRYDGGRMRESDYPSARASIAPFLSAQSAPSTARVSISHTLLFGAIHKQEWSTSDSRVALWTVAGGGHDLRAARISALGILDFLSGF
jgi:hypothetical protein